MNSIKRNVIIAGGGTGGHIYPGVAIARTLEKAYPDIEVHFVGATGGLEEKIIPREKLPLHTVRIGKLHPSVGLLARVRTLLTLPIALWRVALILRELKPISVLGVGGFASGPILFVASFLRYRTLIWEPNAYPGLTNRWLAGRVSECLVVFDEAGKFLKARRVTKSGLPVRSTMVPAPDLNQSGRLRILVFGGSQGARFINNLMCDTVAESLRSGEQTWLERVEIIHQTGAADFTRIRDAYRAANVPSNIQVFEYLHDMDARYHWADFVICRSGASTVAEICACEKAALFYSAADGSRRSSEEKR